MKLTRIATCCLSMGPDTQAANPSDPMSCRDGVDCPTVYAKDAATLVVQGNTVFDPEVLAALHLPVGEGAVEIPLSLLIEAAARVAGEVSE